MNYETGVKSTLDAGQYKTDDAASPKSNRRWVITSIIIVFFIIAALAAFTMMNNQKPAAAADEDEKKTAGQSVTVISPGANTVVRTINATGTLAARREIPVGVVGEGGRVVRVFADAGDWVAKGQTLVSIDQSVQSREAQSLQAQIGVARADLQLAESELDRALKLIDRGFVSKADVDRRTATRDSARARVDVAIAQLGAAQARNARLDIRAPTSGYVLERNVEPGQTVSGGNNMLFRIAEGGQMELRAQLSEADLAAVSQGVPASVSPVGSDRIFDGRIWQISPVIDPQTRQGTARVALPFDRALRPGGFANVAIKAGAVTAPVLPESAIQTDNEGSYVYIIDKQNKAVRRAVKLGDIGSSGITIIEGLDGKERVVLRASGFLSPGETVIPKPVKS